MPDPINQSFKDEEIKNLWRTVARTFAKLIDLHDDENVKAALRELNEIVNTLRAKIE